MTARFEVRCTGRNTKKFNPVLGTLECDRGKGVGVVFLVPDPGPLGGGAVCMFWKKWKGLEYLSAKRNDLPLLRKLPNFQEAPQG